MSYRDNLAAAQARADAAMKSLAIERDAREDDAAHVASLERTLASSLQELAELREQGPSDEDKPMREEPSLHSPIAPPPNPFSASQPTVSNGIFFFVGVAIVLILGSLLAIAL